MDLVRFWDPVMGITPRIARRDLRQVLARGLAVSCALLIALWRLVASQAPSFPGSTALDYPAGANVES